MIIPYQILQDLLYYTRIELSHQAYYLVFLIYLKKV